ncbi:MAG: hypothetical protein PHI13_16490, partial [Methylococcales bacterium]|nr:hypothetical protein [Methylococcales bacterium]
MFHPIQHLLLLLWSDFDNIQRQANSLQKYQRHIRLFPLHQFLSIALCLFFRGVHIGGNSMMLIFKWILLSATDLVQVV